MGNGKKHFLGYKSGKTQSGQNCFANFISNDKPLIINYDNIYYFPIFNKYPETTFGGDFETEADYKDPYVKKLIKNKGWLIMPLIPYTYDTIIRDLDVPAPSPPSRKNLLGTDDQARDVLARLIYGFRISILFGFTLTFFSMIIGVSAGAVQGYFGGKIDLIFQRFMEIWSAIPTLYILIILSIKTITHVIKTKNKYDFIRGNFF
jgi:microcin C transport system permease protein